MANMTDYLENKLLDTLLGVSAYTFPSTVYMALFTADPTDTGDVTSEVSGGSYARVSLSGKFSTATGSTGLSANTTAISFPTATASWGEVTHVGIMESGVVSTDDMLLWGAFQISQTIDDTDILLFAVGDFSLTLE